MKRDDIGKARKKAGSTPYVHPTIDSSIAHVYFSFPSKSEAEVFKDWCRSNLDHFEDTYPTLRQEKYIRRVRMRQARRQR